METINLILLVLAVVVAIPAAVIVAEVLLTLGMSPRAPWPVGQAVPIAVLIPAYNEAAGIAPVLHSIRRQLTSADRVIVIADNCSDRTAGVAEEQGCEVIERQDPTRRGKGFALEFGLTHLRKSEWDGVIVVIDADCVPAERSIATIAIATVVSGRPAQGKYMMRSPSASAAPRFSIAEFAWVVKNHVRPLGLSCVGMPCPLFGTGMAFTCDQLDGVSLANGALAEDMQLGMELALKGKPPIYVPGAEFSSTFAASKSGAKSQRRRWEHGHLSASVSGVPKLLLRAAKHGDPRALAMALDLLVPPLALLVMVLAATSGTTFVWMAQSGHSGPFSVVATGAALFAVSLLLAWHRFGRDIISGKDLISALPRYVLSKMGLYASFFTSRQRAWVRTDRGTDDRATKD